MHSSFSRMCLAMCLGIISLSGCAGMEIVEDDIDMAYQEWCAPSKTVEVINVHDGDTFKYFENEDHAIRMLGVAAPEVWSTSGPAECYGDIAGDFLRDIIDGEEVRLEFDMECTDMYHRTLAWTLLRGTDPQIIAWMQQYNMLGMQSDGSYEILVNELLVMLGYAKVFHGDVDHSVRYKERMLAAETNAKTLQLGLWSACN